MLQADQHPKISFCTACMNRAHHLKQTLPKNIIDNSEYDNIEFVVLNYNSQDDLDQWIYNEMSEHLKNGKLKYYHTIEPSHFHMSHAKNAVAKLATGDLICNVDADNFIGEGFATYIASEFNADPNIFLSVSNTHSTHDCLGRICMKAKDFHSVKGYDESMKGYGFEDTDLNYRLTMLGLQQKFISDSGYLKALKHSDDERLKDEKNNLDIQDICVRHLNHYSSELWYLFKDGSLVKGTIIENRLKNSRNIENISPMSRKHEYRFSILGNRWEYGHWQTSAADNVQIQTPARVISIGENKMEVPPGKLIQIQEQERIREMIMFYSTISNRIKMYSNRSENKVRVNKTYGLLELIDSET